MRSGWRISYQCPDPTCQENHRITGTPAEVLEVARQLVEVDCRTMLIQEETVALMAELDMAEEGRRDPQLVTDITQVYNKLKRLHYRPGEKK